MRLIKSARRVALIIASSALFVANADQAFHSQLALGSQMPQGKAISLSAAISNLEQGEQLLKIQGKVTEVCQAKGCWMILVDEKDSSLYARITFKDYGFFVPVETSMQRSQIFGELSEHSLTKERAQHYAEDAGKDPSTIVEEITEYTIVAHAVQLEAKS